MIDRWSEPSSKGVLPNVCVCVSLIVITCNSNFLHLQRLGRGQTKNERNILSGNNNIYVLLSKAPLLINTSSVRKT